MQNIATSVWSPTSSDWTDVPTAVAVGTAISWVAKLLFGAPFSALPVCVILAVRYARAAQIQGQARAELKQMHLNEIHRLRAALDKQQEQHLAVIRKMKLEQNQILLKCHELEKSLRP